MAGIFFPWSIKITVLYVQGSLQDRPKPCANCDPVLVLFALLPSYGNPLETRIETPEATAPGFFVALIYCQCNQCSTASWDDFQHIYIYVLIYIYTHTWRFPKMAIPPIIRFLWGFSIQKNIQRILGVPPWLSWTQPRETQTKFASRHVSATFLDMSASFWIWYPLVN